MVTEKAYAKINLSLDICGKREDGYHELKSVMQTVGIFDTLTFEKTEGEVIIECDSEAIPLGDDNLIAKTFKLLKEEYSIKGGLKVKLEKRIPVAAGMAGGSADSAATFRGVNRLYNLGLSTATLERLAARLGSDISFCIEGGCTLCEGRGEILTKLPFIKGLPVLVAKPPVFVSTKEVYTKLDSLATYSHPKVMLMTDKIKEDDFAAVLELLGNSLQDVTEPILPVITDIKAKMQEFGALKTLMSGSGPSVFGFFETVNAAEEAKQKIDLLGFAGDTFVTGFVGGNDND